jgi:hypothetical protein
LHANRCAAGRGGQRHLGLLRDRTPRDRADARGLAGARAARYQRQALCEGVAHGVELGRVGLQAGGSDRRRARLAEALGGLPGQQPAHQLRQFGLEPRRRRAIDPRTCTLEVAAEDERVDQLLVDGGAAVGAKQPAQRFEQRVERHARATAALGLGQQVDRAGARPLAARRRHPDCPRNPVG